MAERRGISHCATRRIRDAGEVAAAEGGKNFRSCSCHVPHLLPNNFCTTRFVFSVPLLLFSYIWQWYREWHRDFAADPTDLA